MRLRVEHDTTYTYSKPVFLEPHHLYFTPSDRPYIKVISHSIQLDPVPDGLARRMDQENNFYEQCWYNQLISELHIRVVMEVETNPFNPFDFLQEEQSKTSHNQILNVYQLNDNQLDKELVEWSKDIKQETSDPMGFLSGLGGAINNGWEHQERYSRKLLPPLECFKAKKGSCRDLSWMLINVLRHYEIPARFVSGYSHNPELEGHELHAWVEAWIPGGGWISLDPSSGLFTTETYIPVAMSYHPQNTLPVQGSFRGDAQSKLETRVVISTRY